VESVAILFVAVLGSSVAGAFTRGRHLEAYVAAYGRLPPWDAILDRDRTPDVERWRGRWAASASVALVTGVLLLAVLLKPA
jgi:hypothetical protein